MNKTIMEEFEDIYRAVQELNVLCQDFKKDLLLPGQRMTEEDRVEERREEIADQEYKWGEPKTFGVGDEKQNNDIPF